MTLDYQSLPGSQFFERISPHDIILLAANTRMVPGVVDGIFKAAKATNSAIIFELARSECNLSGGYTGLVPRDFAERVRNSAKQVGHPYFLIHADHTTMKKGTEEEIEETKKLLRAHIDAGYTSFSIDASFLFNENASDTYGQLKRNIEVTAELADFIKDKMGNQEFGLEVEVGEIGKIDPKTGMVVTTVDEATTFISALKDRDIHPQVLAIANGSVHGMLYDEHGSIVEQVSIDIERTSDIARALHDSGVKIAQHGITGTPLSLITKNFPRDAIIKGNVGTLWMNIVWEVFNVFEPELYDEIWNWVIGEFSSPAEKKPEPEVFGKNSKYAFKEFFSNINNVSKDTLQAIEAKSYAEAIMFFKAFGSVDSARHLKP